VAFFSLKKLGKGCGGAHQEAQGRDLEQDAQLGLGGGGGHVGKYALLLHDDLEHIRHLWGPHRRLDCCTPVLHMVGDASEMY